MKLSRIYFTLVILIATGVACAAIQMYGDNDDEQLQKLAHISMEQAQQKALETAPGKVSSGELELEDGLLLYSFDIETASETIREVQINAKDGSLISSKEESQEEVAAELAADSDDETDEEEITGSITVQSDKDLDPLSKISEQSARKAALALVEGTVKKTTLENENGISGL